MVHLSSVDLNLLVVASALYRHKNVSKAAQELGLSQSAVSHALARLRDHFGDPFFVRASRGVVATEFARSIQSELLDLVHRAELLVNRKTAFDPKSATGRITLSSTDYLESVVLPRLLPVIANEAPHVQISLRPTVGELPKRDLEEGKIDFAIAGFYADLPQGYYQTRLFTDSFRSAVRKNHPRLSKGRMSVDDYYSAQHALITLQGDFRDSSERKKKREREIVYGSYSFTGMAWVLQESNLVLTAPGLLLKRYQEHFPIQVFPCPVDYGKLEMRMVWHALTHEDPLRAWFRGKISQACAKLNVER